MTRQSTHADNDYPPGPTGVPADLAEVSASYRRHAWLALLGLLGFLGVYLWLTYAFIRVAIRTAIDSLQAGFWTGVIAVMAAILSVFMLKALLFVVRTKTRVTDLETTAADQPRLFAFLNRLADEAGAPRPHRVFLSARVNAAVFYDLSFFNLLVPSKKNLEIGLGLVNTLSLGELKAVLAHEFGHFGQRSMAVGRWVYTAQQIAGQIVARRDWLDRMLQSLSTIDIRISWIAWVVRLVVWSVRALMDTVFGLVLRAQRALSREMEFQADLVSVRLCGSDALIHALHKLGAGDESWERTLGVAGTAVARKNAVPDLFALQTRMIERVRQTLDDDRYGSAPPLPEAGRERHRVFEDQLAEAPRMWATHPSNRDREDNAKRTYVEAPLDDRPAWTLFDDPEGLRRKVTQELLSDGAANERTMLSNEDALRLVDEPFEGYRFRPAYRGVYLNRSIVETVDSPDSLYDSSTPDEDPEESLDALYPASLASVLSDWRSHSDTATTLKALEEGILTAPGNVIRHQGRTVPRADLPQLIERVRDERRRSEAEIIAHDRRCRTAHRRAARLLGQDWEEHLVGLAKLLHYATHALRDVIDAHGHFQNVLAIVIADGRVSDAESKRLVRAGDELHAALAPVYLARFDVRLPAEVAARLELSSWSEALGSEFALPPASEADLGNWMDVYESWVRLAVQALGALETEALESLLEAEAKVADALRQDVHPGPAPEPAVVPGSYRTLLPGRERERQKRLGWWDRFQLADGLVPEVLRLAVAVVIVGSVLGYGGDINEARAFLHNGLATTVQVEAGGRSVTLRGGATVALDLDRGQRLQVTTTTPDGHLVESFDVNIEDEVANYVYDVARASALIEWTVVYGNGKQPATRYRGNPRWSKSAAHHAFEEPPKSMKLRSGQSRQRLVLEALPGLSSLNRDEALPSPDDRAALVLAHVEWDDAASPDLESWMYAAAHEAAFPATLERRLARNPLDVLALRLQQDVASEDEKPEVCGRHAALAAAHPANGDLHYLVSRCLSDEGERRLAYHYGEEQFPESRWYWRAAVLTLLDEERWEEAVALLRRTDVRVPSFEDRRGYLIVSLSRLLGQRIPAPELTALKRTSPTLARHLQLEAGLLPKGDPLLPYQALAKGDLPGAVRRSDPQSEARMLRLVAASDRAPLDLVARASTLDAEAGLDEFTVWPTLGLARRRGELDKASLARANRFFASEVVERILPFGERELVTNDLDRLLAELRAVPFELRAHAYVFALVVHGEKAPARLRDAALAFLFAWERPWFETAIEGAASK